MLLPYGLPVAPPTFGFSFHHPLHSPSHISESLVSGASNPSVPLYSPLLSSPSLPCPLSASLLAFCLLSQCCSLSPRSAPMWSCHHPCLKCLWLSQKDPVGKQNPQCVCVCVCFPINILKPTAKILTDFHHNFAQLVASSADRRKG